MYKPESVIENETYKIILDLEIQTNHPIPSGRSDIVFINKKKRTSHLVDFAVPANYIVKIRVKKLV